MKNINLATIGAVFVITTYTQSAFAQPLVVDISQRLISITSSFSGKEIVLFGAIEESGEIIVVVKGPEENILVRRKERVAGIWMNRTSLPFRDVPSYYAIASSKPLNENVSKELYEKFQLSAASIGIGPADSATDVSEDELVTFSEALIRNKQERNLYIDSKNIVVFSGRLFRSALSFPAGAKEGKYLISTYLLRDGKIAAKQHTPLFVSKAGLERAIYDLSREKPAIYGLAAIAIAVISGWVAAVAFRKT